MPGADWGEILPPRSVTFDRVIAFDQSSKSLVRSLRLQARQRLLVARTESYVRWYHRILFHACWSEGLCTRYVARYYYDMLFGTPASEDFLPPRLNLPPAQWRDSLRQTSGVVINPVSGWKRKCWTVEGWKQVIQAVLKMGLGPVSVTGGDAGWHQDMCREICDGFSSSEVQNIAGRTSLREFLVRLADTSLTITVDGAASHITQAFGKPTVVLFGLSKTQMWHFDTPRNRAIHSTEFSEEKFSSVANLPTERLPPTTLIPPERVIAEVQNVLSTH